jgi:hypothetical protein
MTESHYGVPFQRSICPPGVRAKTPATSPSRSSRKPRTYILTERPLGARLSAICYVAPPPSVTLLFHLPGVSLGTAVLELSLLPLGRPRENY